MITRIRIINMYNENRFVHRDLWNNHSKTMDWIDDLLNDSPISKDRDETFTVLNGKNFAEHFWNLLIELGYNDFQSAGILGTIFTEGGNLNPGIISNSGYIGLFQIAPANSTNLLEFYASELKRLNLNLGKYEICIERPNVSVEQLINSSCRNSNCFCLFCVNRPISEGGRTLELHSLNINEEYHNVQEWFNFSMFLAESQFNFSMKSSRFNNNAKPAILLSNCVEEVSEMMIVGYLGRQGGLTQGLWATGTYMFPTDDNVNVNSSAKVPINQWDEFQQDILNRNRDLKHPSRKYVPSVWGNVYQAVAKARATSVIVYNTFSSNEPLRMNELHRTTQMALEQGVTALNNYEIRGINIFITGDINRGISMPHN